MALFFVGFVISGFLVPPSPQNSAEQMAELFRDHKYPIRIGMIVIMFSAALLGPWVAAVSVQLRRIEGRHSPLADIQLGMGFLLVLEIIFLSMFWQVATFRPERSAESIQLINDLAWIPFAGLTSTVIIQALSIGIAILMDSKTAPVFPRWAGYLNLWAAVVWVGGTFNVFFKSGPLAWNGVIAWYMPIGMYGIWLTAMSSLLLREVRANGKRKTGGQPRTEVAPGIDIWDVERLAAELAEVRRDLGRVTNREA
jgi:hypothetical protein